MPVRIPKNPSVSVTGYFPSLKLSRMVAFESTLERDYLYLLDFEAAVTTFEEQPLALTYEHNGKTRRYTPDFLIREADREVLVECKPEAKLEHNDNPLKFAAARAYCEARGWSFRVVTDTELRRGYLLENVKQLTYYARYQPPRELTAALFGAVDQSGTPVTLSSLHRNLPRYALGEVRAAVRHLTYHHRLLLNLKGPLDTSTVVRNPEQKGVGNGSSVFRG